MIPRHDQNSQSAIVSHDVKKIVVTKSCSLLRIEEERCCALCI